MLAIQIKEIKAFMGKLLNTDTFDSFLLEEAKIQTFVTHTIDGHIQKDFFTKEELAEPDFLPYGLSSWKDLKTICFQLIKGKKTPLYFKLTLIQNPQESYTLLEKAGAAGFSSLLKSFVVNIKFDPNGLLLTTGTSMNTFLMDKTPDLVWDEAFRQFLRSHAIDFEEL